MNTSPFQHFKSLCRGASLLTLWLFCLSLTSCSAQYNAGQQQALMYGQQRAMAFQGDILRAQEQHWSKVQVTVQAPVAKMLREDTEGIPHERFLIQLANGSTVLVAHDTNMAPFVPLHAGDTVTIHGEYIWTERGGVLHWTHHTDTPRHEGGWIDYNGQRYQ